MVNALQTVDNNALWAITLRTDGNNIQQMHIMLCFTTSCKTKGQPPPLHVCGYKVLLLVRACC